VPSVQVQRQGGQGAVVALRYRRVDNTRILSLTISLLAEELGNACSSIDVSGFPRLSPFPCIYVCLKTSQVVLTEHHFGI